LAEKLVLKKSLPRAWSKALGKDLKKICRITWFEEKKTFAEGLTGGPQQSLTGNGRRDPTGLICRGHLCRGPWPSAKISFAVGLSLPRAVPSAKASLPRAVLCRGLLWLALGKECLCRVPEIWPSAKHAFPVVTITSHTTKENSSGLDPK